MAMTSDMTALTEKIREKSAFIDPLRREIGKAIIGQHYMIDRMIIAFMTGGHVLLEGVPGLAKTLTVSSLARAVTADFHRIQFTPDLLPADLTGTMIYNQKTTEFVPKKGPVFTNILLADEINRAPAKVQSALLEAMQEHQVTIGETTYPVPEPFLVLATQNPIEQEGTYPLPEAQVDRFMLKLTITYPSKEEERQILSQVATGEQAQIEPVVSADSLMQVWQDIKEIYMDKKVEEYIINLVHATRHPAEAGLKDLAGLIEYGVSPRAGIYLARCSRAHAFLHGRGYVTPEDIKALGGDILRHRIMLTYEAEAENVSTDDVIQKIFEGVEVP
jgi:MoxR-like ATPase